MSNNVKLMEKNFLNNGLYQKIVWLGVHGFLIINEPKKEILMIDPWPSYSEKTINHSVKVNQLTDWLFNADRNGYKLIGIIGTHEHYDHIADIPAIIFNLHFDKKERKLTNGFPPLCSDKGTFDEIKKRYLEVFGIQLDIDTNFPISFEDLSSFNELKLGNIDLYYNDKVQAQRQEDGKAHYPLKAGNMLAELTLGNYSITPFIWDHVSTSPYFDDLEGDLSGNLQRCTALRIRQKEIALQDKSLLIVGSAGEMSHARTGGFVRNYSEKIETDMLIQAVPHKIVTESNYLDILIDLIDYQDNNIQVNDMIIASHFETFIDLSVPTELIGYLLIFFGALVPFVPLGPGAGVALIGVGDVEKKISCFYGDLEKEENKERVYNYANLLFTSTDIQLNKVYYLNRFLIEFGFRIIVEVEDGYEIHEECILEHTDALEPIDKIWLSGFNVFAIHGNSILLFKDQFLANPNSKEVHNLRKVFVIFDNNRMYVEQPGCNMDRMNFKEMRHFETEEEAFKVIDGVKPYNGCSRCFLERDTDHIDNT